MWRGRAVVALTVNRTDSVDGGKMTESDTLGRILMVDDEPNALDGYRRALRGRFKVFTAGSGVEGLALVKQGIAQGTPFPVVVSDMMMPGMNGAEFLGLVRQVDATAVQLLLSGQADLDSTITAVNNGNLFRFLTKPCAAPDLSTALTAATEQHRLVGVEKELLTNTLTGAVDVLTELIATVSPEASTRTEQIRLLIDKTSSSLAIADWRLPLAAMLSQVGCIAVPADVLRRVRTYGPLTAAERDVYFGHPKVASRLLQRIPRLEAVAEWVGNQPIRIDDPHDPQAEPAQLLLGAVIAYLLALDETGTAAQAMALLTEKGRYPAPILEAIREASAGMALEGVIRELKVGQVRPGMLLDSDIRTKTGLVLVRRGERLTEAATMRLGNFARTVGIKEPIMIMESP